MTEQDEIRLEAIEGRWTVDGVDGEDAAWLIDRLNTTLAKLTLAEGAKEILGAMTRSEPKDFA